MTLPALLLDTTGNVEVADAQRVSWDSQANVKIAGALQPYIVAGTGAPTFTAPQGSMYIRIDGGAGARLYMNSTGSTTWIVAGSAA
jgi:hypothetical protein